MEGCLRLLYPPAYDSTGNVSVEDFGFIQALQIDDMVVLARESYRGISDLSLEKYFTTDTAVLDYRLSVVEDLVENPVLYEAFCESIPIICNIRDMRRIMSGSFSAETALGSVRCLEMYEEIVDLFAEKLSGVTLHSEGLKAFRDEILSITQSRDFQNLKTELSKMEVRFGGIKSIKVGINLDETLSVSEAGILSVEREHFRSGTVIDRLLKKNDGDSMVLMSPLLPVARGLHGEELKGLNYTIKEALNGIFKKSIRSFEPVVQKYYNVNTALFEMLLEDIRFLTAGVKFIRDMKDRGFAMCRPQIAAMAEKKCDLTGVYNPVLAMQSIEHAIIDNDFTFDEKGRFYLVTGPNHGGKSIFAYSVGMAQALFQLGLFVPAKSARMSPVSGIYTHFPSSDENNYGKGRLESECARLGEIMKKLKDTDMLLMDETFSSTSGLEAGYIASEVLTGIGVIGCGGIYVTHIHDLTQQTGDYNAYPGNRGKIDNLVALMENKADGSRSYKIARTTPDGLSYARDIAGRYGLDLESILHR